MVILFLFPSEDRERGARAQNDGWSHHGRATGQNPSGVINIYNISDCSDVQIGKRNNHFREQ